jgi:riboflavin biosynthesis pyrimidine reductase
VVSRSLDLAWDARVFADAPAQARTFVVTCAAADPDRVAAARQVASVVVAGDERVDPALAVRELAALGHRVVLCEGGPRWLGEVVAADRLDELFLSVSPLIGGDPLPVCVNPSGAAVHRFRLAHAMTEADALFLRYERSD